MTREYRPPVTHFRPRPTAILASNTWTQDSSLKQVSFPVQTSDGFHYLQATAGSQRQAALGSDQHLYTWNSQQSTPVTLGSGQNTGFTSIGINNDLLLAADRQGKVHAFLNNQIKGQNLDPKPAEQETISLPGQTQAVLTTT